MFSISPITYNIGLETQYIDLINRSFSEGSDHRYLSNGFDARLSKVENGLKAHFNQSAKQCITTSTSFVIETKEDIVLILSIISKVEDMLNAFVSRLELLVVFDESHEKAMPLHITDSLQKTYDKILAEGSKVQPHSLLMEYVFSWALEGIESLTQFHKNRGERLFC